jgi:NAD dependent epimerase/dehydratase family enzyme
VSTASAREQSYEVTGPEPLTIAQMIQTISQVLGRHVHYIRIPKFVATLWMRRVGMSRRLVNAMSETLAAWDRDEYAYVSNTVRQVTGRAPSTFESWVPTTPGPF